MVKIKKILLLVMLFLIISTSANAFNFTKFIFESAIETDRQQSYAWYFATKDNPVIINRYPVHEANDLVVSRDRKTFDKKIDIAKDFINNIDNELIYTAITLIELYVVYENNQNRKKYGLGEVWTISYSWEF